MPTRKISEVTELHVCRDPDHNPPQHRVFEPGLYEHKCPRCGKKTIFAVKRAEMAPVPQPRAAIRQVAPKPSWVIDNDMNPMQAIGYGRGDDR